MHCGLFTPMAKDFLVVAYPNKSFNERYPARSSLGVVLFGVLMTIAVALVVAMLMQGRFRLEKLVGQRTTDLLDINKRFNQMAGAWSVPLLGKLTRWENIPM